MVAMVITIIVVIIISTVVITSSSESVYQATETKIMQELTEVKKGVDSVRLTNAKSGKTDEESINAGFIKVRVVDPPDIFVSFDDEAVATGYAVDLSTIDYDKLESGRGYLSLMKGDEVVFNQDDVYLYDAAGKVYYAKGYEIGEEDVAYTLVNEERKERPKIEVLSTVAGNIEVKVTPAYGGEISSVTVGNKQATTNDGEHFQTKVNKNGSYKVIATEEGGNSGVEIINVYDINETASDLAELGDVYINNREKYTSGDVATLHVEATNAEYMSVSQDELVVPNPLDFTKWREYSSESTIYLTNQGANTVYVWCKNADNVPTTYKHAEIILDSIPPTQDAPSYVMLGYQIVVTCNQRDENPEGMKVKYGYKKVDDLEYIWQDSPIVVDVEPGSKYMLITNATDMAGNSRDSRTTVTEEVSNIPDSINITATPALEWTNRVLVNIEYPGTYGVSPYENLYRVDGGEWKKATSNRVSMSLIKNSKIEAVVSANLNGQEPRFGTIKSLIVKNVDRVDPYIYDVVDFGQYRQDGFDIQAKVEDEESGVVAWTVTTTRTTPVTWEHEFEATNDVINISHRIEQNGVYYIWAKDAGGNIGYVTAEVANIDLYDPIITSYTVTYDTSGAMLNAKAIDDRLGLIAYAFVLGDAEPAESDWTQITQTTEEYTMSAPAKANGDYYVWVKDVSGRTANMVKNVKSLYEVTYIWYDINDKGEETTEHTIVEGVGCNCYVDLSKTASRDYSEFIGWNTDKNAKTKLDSYKMGDETTGQEDLTLYAIFKYIDEIHFSKSTNDINWELNLTITKDTPFTTLQYSYDNRSWKDYTAPLRITDNITVYARTIYNNEVIATNSITITNICVNHVGTQATCTEASYCTICNYFMASALGHEIGEWVVITGATCTTDGLKERKCIRYAQCGVKEEEVIGATGHNFGEYILTTEPTCVVEGVKTSTCSRCGATQTQSIAATGHNWTKSTKEHTAATCTVPSKLYYQCTKCGAYGETYDGTALGHLPIAEATCTTSKVCQRCGIVLDEALGHDWKDATCTLPKTCKRVGCGATEGTALGHNMEDEYPEDCTRGYKCTRCGIDGANEANHNVVSISALGSSQFEAYIKITKAATCAQTGTCELRCMNVGCAYYEVGTIDALGHIWGEPPTWTWSGVESAIATFKCTRCGGTTAENAAISSALSGGYMVYTAKVTFNGKEYTDQKTVDVTPTVFLYNGKELVFQPNGVPDSGKTVTASWTGFNNGYSVSASRADASLGMNSGLTVSSSSVPWYGYRSAIETVTIRNGVTITCGMYCWFYDCTKLSSVTIGDGVTVIGEGAFYNTSALKSVTIPANVKTIELYAFHNSGLTSVSIGGTNSWTPSYPLAGSLGDLFNSKVSITKASQLTSASSGTTGGSSYSQYDR